MNSSKMFPEVEINLGGKTMKLIFDMWAFMCIEEKTGKNALSGETFSNVSAKQLVTLIWAGLQATEKLSLEEVARKLNPLETTYYMERLGAAFAKAEMSAEQAEKKESAAVEMAKPVDLDTLELPKA